MKLDNVTYDCENAADFDTVEALSAKAFGPGRFTRTAFRLRENMAHEPHLSFTAKLDGSIVGSVRLTKISIGEVQSLLLGPLVVNPAYKNCGVGKELMRISVAAAQRAGEHSIILVGDFPYYEQFGFRQVPHGQITLPGPVDPARLLVCPLKENAAAELQGMAAKYAGEVVRAD